MLLLRAQIADHLAAVADLFDHAHRKQTRITIVIRTPWLEDGGVLVSDEEDLDAAVAEIQRLKPKEEIRA
jgi:hypothetical protein